MKTNYREMSYEEFLSHIDKLCKNLENYLKDKKIRIDYICPILRGGMVPASYISERLNIVKILPIGVKHVKYKDGRESIEKIFDPFELDLIQKDEPAFLLVDEKHYSGKSAKICIDTIKNKYKNAKILYVCIAKKYGSIDFKDEVIYEDSAFLFKVKDNILDENCKHLDIEPVFPWQVLEFEISHPDDLEDNIFF